MKYIVYKRFHQASLSGVVNLPYGTECESVDHTIFWNDKPICYTTSQNAYDYFARNNDDCGLLRGKLTSNIMNRLAVRDSNHQSRWDKIWDDELCQKYRRDDYDDYWLWNYDFYNAPIWDLQYIEKLISN